MRDDVGGLCLHTEGPGDVGALFAREGVRDGVEVSRCPLTTLPEEAGVAEFAEEVRGAMCRCDVERTRRGDAAGYIAREGALRCKGNEEAQEEVGSNGLERATTKIAVRKRSAEEVLSRVKRPCRIMRMM